MAYEINININDFDGEPSTSGGKLAKKTTDKVAKAQKDLAKFVSAQTIRPFLQNVKTAITQNIQTMTGNAQLQQRVNFAFEVVEFGQGLYQNAAAGAVIGGALGLPSGVGAGIGIALSLVNTGLQIAFNQHQLNLEERMENNQLQQVRQRQGFYYNKSRR